MATLAEMEQGDCVIVHEVVSNGSIRRRLQDIGLIPGTKVECVQKSPLGDPTAFLIRGTVIALRCEDSANIFVQGRIENEIEK